ncbi:hypothetical protein ACFLUR_03800 [Chloroflexota bacterium]
MECGIPVPNGDALSNPDEAETMTQGKGRPVVLKSQISVAGIGN